MNCFTIEPNRFLSKDIDAFYHTNYLRYGTPGNPDYLNTLKNDVHHNWSVSQLNNAKDSLKAALIEDLPQILRLLKMQTLLICVVPRAKAEDTYRADQLFFKSTIQAVANQLDNFIDGTNYISRHTNTKTTHFRKHMEGFINDGELPYPGITMATCKISSEVNGKHILLIDDIYTKTVNIDEDAIQALLNNGASSVTFYAIGHTV